MNTEQALRKISLHLRKALEELHRKDVEFKSPLDASTMVKNLNAAKAKVDEWLRDADTIARPDPDGCFVLVFKDPESPTGEFWRASFNGTIQETLFTNRGEARRQLDTLLGRTQKGATL